jgi:hypothetical protein
MATWLYQIDQENWSPQRLLAGIRDIFKSCQADEIESAVVVDRLIEKEDRPWPEWGKQRKPITQAGLARLLKPFRIKAKQIRFVGANHRGYYRGQFDDAFARYLPDESATPLQASSDAGSSDIQSATDDGGVAVCNSRKPAPHKACSTVALSKPGNGTKVWTRPVYQIIETGTI